jgi:hypothetical protein
MDAMGMIAESNYKNPGTFVSEVLINGTQHPPHTSEDLRNQQIRQGNNLKLDLGLVHSIEEYKMNMDKKKQIKEKLESYYRKCNLQDKLILSSSNLTFYEKMKLKSQVYS